MTIVIVNNIEENIYVKKSLKKQFTIQGLITEKNQLKIISTNFFEKWSF